MRFHSSSFTSVRRSHGALWILPSLIAGLLLTLADQVKAQTFTTLYSFQAGATNSSKVYTNSDGINPYAGLIAAGDSKTRYGTTSLGGTGGFGTVFAIHADGTGFTNLHTFNYLDGARPWAGLVASGSTLYGTTIEGGSSSNGVVFAINTDGTGFKVLHSFPDTDAREVNDGGAYPNGGLVLAGDALYGTASMGGSSGVGTVFVVQTDGTAFVTLHSFTLSDGAVPVAGLILAGSKLYGTATGGGSGANGTVFALNTDGTGFTVLHGFDSTQGTCTWDFQCPTASYQCTAGVCTCRGFCGGQGW